jgi:Fe-S cluster biogenesis protein NfuA
MASKDQLFDTLRDIVAPLVEHDGGELYLVTAEGDDVKLHLTGTCSGCPGVTLTTRGVIEPALRSVSPHVRVSVSSGALIPQGATRVVAAAKA